MGHAKTSYVCVPCRASYKQDHDSHGSTRERRCPRCAEPMIHVGSAFAPPRRRDTAAWRALTMLLESGVRFHRTGCCGEGPGYRPRAPRETREWLAERRKRTEWTPERRLREAAPRG
ncbi:deoxyxylulose-5-phosphate synthase [Streptomyces sp. HUAS MG47]|uniref:deoxyxylulose-5-phosphate synthase n=1 Tax=Streptomyces solicamelliae TaxID=3231716 RepID=UPI0038780A8D